LQLYCFCNPSWRIHTFHSWTSIIPLLLCVFPIIMGCTSLSPRVYYLEHNSCTSLKRNVYISNWTFIFLVFNTCISRSAYFIGFKGNVYYL
jgi:hypothetical protein